MELLHIKDLFIAVQSVDSMNSKWKQSLSERLAFTYKHIANTGRVNEITIRRLESEVNSYLVENGNEPIAA